jgi:hypothetical protein
MTSKIGPPGWQPHLVVSRLDGFVTVDGRVPDFIADMMAKPKARGGNRSIAAIRARMACRHRMIRRMARPNIE